MRIVLKRRTKIVLIIALLGFVLYAALLGARVIEYQYSINTAAFEGDLAAVLVLLPFSGDLNTTNAMGITPLTHSVLGGNMGVAKTLLMFGADPDGGPDDARRPVVVAAKYGKRAVTRFLLDRGATYDVDVAIPLGDVDYVRKYFETDAYAANYRYFDGETVLLVAVRNKDLEMAQVLLENGADPNHSGVGPRTLLDWARNIEFDEMVELLESYVAKQEGGADERPVAIFRGRSRKP